MSKYNSLAGLAGSSLNPFAGRYDPESQYSMLLKQNEEFGNYGTEMTDSALGFTRENSPGFLGSVRSGLQNEGLMQGILGAGQLGLGLMSYLDQSKVANEQLKALKQNRQQAAANFRAQEQQRAAINSGFSSALS